MSAHISVNLLPKDAFLSSVVGKFLLWSLSIGRYLVVFTELIVILSFLSRFKLDRDLTDLNEEIEVQKRTIQTFADTEQKFRLAQAKVEAIKLSQENQFAINSLNFLEKNLPIDVKLSRISFSPNGWTLEGSALSAQSLRLTAQRVLAENSSSSISLSKVKLNSRTGTIDFGLSVNHLVAAKSVKK